MRRASSAPSSPTRARIAKAGLLTPTRAPLVFLTLQRNRAWWSEGPLLRYGQRVIFAGSQLVWQYYPGQGIQVQWLGTFGRANGLFQQAGRDDELRAAARRGARPGDARAPAASPGSRSSASTAARRRGSAGCRRAPALPGALARAPSRLERPRATSRPPAPALGIFRAPPPEGVRVDTPVGAHYLQYSFAPELHILNGFIQALNGLLRLRDAAPTTPRGARSSPPARRRRASSCRPSTPARGRCTQPGARVRPRLPQAPARLPARAVRARPRPAARLTSTTEADRVHRLPAPAARCSPSSVTTSARAPRAPSQARLHAEQGLDRDAHRAAQGHAGPARARRASATAVTPSPIRPRRRGGLARAPARGRPGRQRRAPSPDGSRSARALSRLTRRPWRPAHDPLHRQGRRRQDLGRRGHRAPLRGRAASTPSCSRPTPRTRWPTSLRTAVGGEPTQVGERLWAQQVVGPGRDGAQLGRRPGLARRAAARARRRPHQRRGAHRPARAWTSSSACCRSSATTRTGASTCVIVDCAPTGETLRLLSFPDVARWWLREGLPAVAAAHGRGAAARARRARRLAARRRGPRRRPAPRAQPHRDERDPARHRAASRCAW